MKFIKNTIDSEILQDSIADADLDLAKMEMANCERKSDVYSGKNQEEITVSDINKMERAAAPKFSNGIHGKSGSPIKCNGKVNGFYEEEEDFNLELEDSSEGGESPSKKIDDDAISAPQIVQAIEDLLGFDSNSAVIQEELNNLDGTESIEDNLDHEEDIEDTQNADEIFEDIHENKSKESQGIDIDKPDLKKGAEKEPLKDRETIECDVSSNMNLVCNEVEVEMENGDTILANQCNSISEVNEERTEESNKEDNLNKANDLVKNESEENIRENDTQGKISERVDSGQKNGEETTLTQNSGVSDASEDWVVVDAIETSDEEHLSEVQNDPLATKNGELGVTMSPECDQKKMNVADSLLPDSNDGLATETAALVTSSKEEKSKDSSDYNTSIPDEKVEPIAESAESSNETTENSFVPDGDGVKKRCAPKDDEEIVLKKPKLEDNSGSVESSSVLKRPSSASIENENKRTKLGATPGACETSGESNVNKNKKSDNIDDTFKDDLKSRIVDILTKGSCEETDQSEKNVSENLVTDNEKTENKESGKLQMEGKEQTTNVTEDIVMLPVVESQPQEKLITDELENSNNMSRELQTVASDEAVLSPDNSRNSVKTATDTTLCCNKPEREDEDRTQVTSKESVTDGKEQDVSMCKKEDEGFKLDDLSTVSQKECSKLNTVEKVNASSIITENTKNEPQISISKELSSSIKELEKSIINSGNEKAHVPHDSKNSEPKKMTNLDFAIERVVEKARIQVEKKVPILKKFHKDQLRKLKRSELEDIVVSKICEAVSYKSEVGQMRLRTQNLEETNEMWRKKVQQIEKQNRELEMVLKRFLAELAHIKRENQEKVPMPIKVTRSVGLQVVLASSMHGALVSSRNKMNNDATHQQQQLAKARQAEKEKVKEPVKATTFMPPSQPQLVRGRGRPPRAPTTQTSRPATPQTLTPKITPPTTPSKPANVTPVKNIQTPNKDLEVIDLTDKEERAKAITQSPVSGSIRVAPSTQVCFVQQSAPSAVPAQPLYLVQKAGQRPQFLVATSSASPQRPMNNVARPPPALALPVFRASGHLIPVQTSQQGVKTSPNTSTTTVARQVPSGLRIQPQAPATQHPAPLPKAPACFISKPGMKNPPPKPQLKIAKTSNGIMLSWSMSLTKDTADMQSYQLYAYQEGNQPPSTGLWKKVGDVKALPLPMACTLTQFIEGHKYHFAVRAVDVHGRIGPFSMPSSILLTK